MAIIPYLRQAFFPKPLAQQRAYGIVATEVNEGADLAARIYGLVTTVIGTAVALGATLEVGGVDVFEFVLALFGAACA